MKGLVSGLIALCACTGCDRAFGLERPDSPAPDAPPPADAVPDAPPDAPFCPGSGHDEDGDLHLDECDNCPADFNATQDDVDSDGVGNACDPSPAASGDRILLFSSFTSTAGYSVTGSTAQDADEVRLGNSTTLATNLVYLPTRVDVGVRYLAPTGTDVIKVFAGNVGGFIDVCLVDLGDPACAGGAPCVGAGVDNFNPTVAAWPGVAGTDKIRIDVAATTFQCTATSSTSSGAATGSATVRNGKVGVIATMTAADRAVVRYLVIYGR